MNNLRFEKTEARSFYVKRGQGDDEVIVGRIFYDDASVKRTECLTTRYRQGPFRFRSNTNEYNLGYVLNNEELRQIVNAVEFLNESLRCGNTEFNL